MFLIILAFRSHTTGIFGHRTWDFNETSKLKTFVCLSTVCPRGQDTTNFNYVVTSQLNSHVNIVALFLTSSARASPPLVFLDLLQLTANTANQRITASLCMFRMLLSDIWRSVYLH